ncbi:MAG TPA: methyltransferase domain-containing protein [Aggregatilineales bacterium]|nr:methyltransferase domain-containing protein [Aggregatilineales bacterium]
MTDLDNLRKFYAQTASRYEAQVVPVFGPLAQSLADWIARCVAAQRTYDLLDPFDLDESEFSSDLLPPSTPALTALDVGTGTAILARSLERLLDGAGRITGMDASPAMLAMAQSYSPAPIRFVQADNHDLPFAANSIHLAVSSFGLNATVPKKSLRALYRVLRKGRGMLAFQEWSVEDEPSEILDATVADHAPPADQVRTIDEGVIAFNNAQRVWYDLLQDTEDFYELLKALGFEQVWVKEAPFTTVHLPSVDVFIAYKMGWPVRRLRIEALAAQDRDAHAAFEADLHDRLRPYTNADGSFDWSPVLFRVCAVK